MGKRHILEVMGMHLFFLILTLFSFRHFWIAGDPLWTGEGTRLSWSMRLSGKYCRMRVRLGSQGEWLRLYTVPLTGFQKVQLGDPYFFLHYVQQLYCQQYPQVYGSLECRAVGRQVAPLVDSQVNLCQVDYYVFQHNTWIYEQPGERDPHYIAWLKQREGIE